MNNLIFKKNFLRQRQGGQAMLISVIFFLFISLAIISGFVSPTIREFRITNDLIKSRQGLFLSESSVEDVYYRLREALTVDSPQTLTLNGDTATTTITDSGIDEKTITSTGDVSSRQRKTETKMVTGDGISFAYGMQIGDGGIDMQGTSQLIGNAFSNGPVVGAANNFIQGDAISGGSDGSINQIRTNLTARAHAITNSVVATDAYYDTDVTNTRVSGTFCPNANCHSGEPDTADIPLPITDTMLDFWKAEAVAGGTIDGINCSTGTYTISVNTTIGRKKINCNFKIKGAGTIVTLIGPLWVFGNITMEDNAIFKINTNESFAVIADKETPLDFSTSRIFINTVIGTTAFQGNGGNGSYILLASQHRGAESVPPASAAQYDAIQVTTAISGDVLLYALHGNISVEQTGVFRVLSGFKLTAKNAAMVGFRAGVIDPIFSSSPDGGWASTSWREVK
ncbi:MAG: hypothetical protein AAB438_02280 [Patescibacteria group bacterium]